MLATLERLKQRKAIDDYERLQDGGVIKYRIDTDNRSKSLAALDDAAPERIKIRTTEADLYVWDPDQASTGAARSR